MKKLLLLSISLLFALGLFAQEDQRDSIFRALNLPKYPVWTFEEVKNMVKDYNVEAFLTDGDKNLLRHMSREQIIAWAKQTSAYVKVKEEVEAYLSETKNVRTIDDLLALYEKYPSIKQDLVSSYGGEEKYKAYYADLKKRNFYIYLNQRGEIILADRLFDHDPSVTRLDNLPRN